MKTIFEARARNIDSRNCRRRHASAIAESIVAPTLFRPEFSHSLGQNRTFSRPALDVRFLLKGDGSGRRDYVHLYEMDQLRATVKQQMKIHWPPPSVNPAMAQVFNLYWDPREEHPLKSAGVWTGTPFVRMRVQHMRMKDKWPDRPSARGMPYEDVENIRPETKAMVETWLKIYGMRRMSSSGSNPPETSLPT